MKKIIGSRYLGCFVLLFVLCFSCLIRCSKMDDTYKDFIKDGERIYMGMVDSLNARPGLNRVQLSWLAISDRRVVKATIFWNNRTSKKDVPIQKTAGIDTISVMLNDMPEENYAFEVITYDDKDNFSMPVNITANVYGEQYVTSLFNRPIKSIKKRKKSLQINWDVASKGTVGTEIEYTDVSDQMRTIKAPGDELETILTDYKKGAPFRYRTSFLPDTLALDTVYTNFEVVD